MTRDRSGQLAAPVAHGMQLQAAMITSTWIVLAAVAIVLVYVFAGERSLQNNSKVEVPAGSRLVSVIGDIAGVLPLPARATRVAPREPAEHVVQ